MGFMDSIKEGISKFANNITSPVLVNYIVKEMKKENMSFADLKDKLYAEIQKNPMTSSNKKIQKKAQKKIDKLLKKVKEKLEKEQK